jgi:hypothetical protein
MKYKAILVWIAVFALAFFFRLNVVHAQPREGIPELPGVTPRGVRVPDKPDLSVDISGRGLGHLTDLYPDNPGRGPDRFFVRGMVLNGGGVAVSAKCEVDIFLSKDTTVSPDDRLMERIVLREAIPPREPRRYGSALIPRRDYSIIGIPAGTYYICARVDPRNRIKESNEANNDHCYPPAIRIHEAGSRR